MKKVCSNSPLQNSKHPGTLGFEFCVKRHSSLSASYMHQTRHRGTPSTRLRHLLPVFPTSTPHHRCYSNGAPAGLLAQKCPFEPTNCNVKDARAPPRTAQSSRREQAEKDAEHCRDRTRTQAGRGKLAGRQAGGSCGQAGRGPLLSRPGRAGRGKLAGRQVGGPC